MPSNHSALTLARLARLAATAMLLLTLGCFTPPPVDYLNAEIYASRSGLRKDVYLLIVYNGLHALPDGVQAGAEALERFVSEEYGILWHGAWLGGSSTFSIPEWRAELGEMEDVEIEEAPANFRYATHVVKNLEVRFGGLFQNKEAGRLCAYQVARLRKVKRFVKLANAALCETAVSDDDGFIFDSDNPSTATEPFPFPRTDALWTQLCRKGRFQWFELDGSAVAVNLPADPAEVPAMRKMFLEEGFFPTIRDDTTTTELQSVTEFLAQHPFSLIQRNDGFRFVFGDPESQVNQLVLAPSDDELTSHTNNLLPWAAKQESWRGEVDVEDLVAKMKTAPAKLFKSLAPKKTQRAKN